MITGTTKRWSKICKAAVTVPLLWLLFALTVPGRSMASSRNEQKTNDTLPQTDILKLKRADVYMVVTDQDMAKVRLRKGDSIVMNRTNFDALPVEVKKEISAHNDGMFNGEKTEISYPGGPSAWMRHMSKTFKYPPEAMSNNTQGTVIVQFIVDELGKTSNIEAISGPTSGGLREESIRVVQKSGKWTPATINGYNISSTKYQLITFKLDQ